MNWQKIKTDYPKAYNKYIAWNCAKNPNCPSKECYDFNIRDLFDFFDENKIYIHIEVDTMYDSEKGSEEFICFNPMIITNHSVLCTNSKSLFSRCDAERSAFNEAFEILNNKLK